MTQAFLRMIDLSAGEHRNSTETDTTAVTNVATRGSVNEPGLQQKQLVKC